MTGIVGGTVGSTALQAMMEPLKHESGYEGARFEDGEFSLGLLHHGDTDRYGHETWQDRRRAGVIHGATVPSDSALTTTADVFERFFDRPDSVLPALEGSFLIAGYDADDDRFLVATDKLGCRPCYYSTQNGLTFGSELKGLLPYLDEWELDLQAVSDLLLMGHLWGEKTLLREVNTLPPSSLLEFEDGEMSVRRYWKCNYETKSPRNQYLQELIRRYRSAVGDISDTMHGTVGLYLSGGLDSRSLAAALSRNARSDDSFDALLGFTYDANPAGGGNPRLAQQVAGALGMDIDEIELTPNRFLENLERTVDLTDGMINWSSMVNLASAFQIASDSTNFLLEGAGQGELIGHHLRQYHFTDCDSAVESMYESERSASASAVRSVLAPNLDPFATFESVAADSPESTTAGKILDAHFQNYYGRFTLASNKIARSRFGTRVPFVDGDFLQHAARMPLSYRMGTFPLTDGKIPYGATKPKLELIRTLDGELARIPYERTSVRPSRPLAVHVMGFVTSTAWSRLRDQTTYGGRRMFDEWYRRNSDLRKYLNGLLDDARSRPFFDEATIRDLQRDHLMERAHNMNLISPITTLECWLQMYADG